MIDGWGISCEINLRWMSMDFTDDNSTLVQVVFGAIRQQAITYANVDPDLCHHMVFNYIFIVNLTPGFNGLGKNYKMRWETFKFGDLVCLILENWWYFQVLRLEFLQICLNLVYESDMFYHL